MQKVTATVPDETVPDSNKSSDKSSENSGENSGSNAKSSDKSVSKKLTDTSLHLFEEPTMEPLAEKLLKEIRMRTLADIKRDHNQTQIALKRVKVTCILYLALSHISRVPNAQCFCFLMKVEELREKNEQKRLCLEEKHMAHLLESCQQRI